MKHHSMVMQPRRFNHTSRSKNKQLRMKNMSYVPILPRVEEFSQSSGQSSEGPQMKINESMVQIIGAKARFQNVLKSPGNEGHGNGQRNTSSLQDLIRLKNELESNPGSRVQYLSKINKKHLSKVSEQQSPGSLVTISRKSDYHKNISKVSKLSKQVSETVEGSQKSISRIGQISRTMKVMSPHKMKKKKNKSMISSYSQQALKPPELSNSPKRRMGSPGLPESNGQYQYQGAKFSQIMPQLQSQIIGVYTSPNPSCSVIYSGGQKSNSLKNSLKRSAQEHRVSFNDTTRSQGNFKDGKEMMQQPSMIFHREAAVASQRSRSNGQDVEYTNIMDSQHGFRSHSLLQGIIKGKSRVSNPSYIGALKNGSQLSRITKKDNNRNQTKQIKTLASRRSSSIHSDESGQQDAVDHSIRPNYASRAQFISAVKSTAQSKVVRQSQLHLSKALSYRHQSFAQAATNNQTTTSKTLNKKSGIHGQANSLYLTNYNSSSTGLEQQQEKSSKHLYSIKSNQDEYDNPDNTMLTKQVVKIKQCKLGRQRYNNEKISANQTAVVGDIRKNNEFESTLNHINNKGRMSKKVNMNLRSNSLSEIESINSAAENERTLDGAASNAGTGRSPMGFQDSACLQNEDNESYQKSQVYCKSESSKTPEKIVQEEEVDVLSFSDESQDDQEEQSLSFGMSKKHAPPSSVFGMSYASKINTVALSQVVEESKNEATGTCVTPTVENTKQSDSKMVQDPSLTDKNIVNVNSSAEKLSLQNSVLQHHQQQYNLSKTISSSTKQNWDEYKDIESQLKEKFIRCVKYNNEMCLKHSESKVSSLSTLRLSQNGDKLIIQKVKVPVKTNEKKAEDLDNTIDKYIKSQLHLESCHQDEDGHSQDQVEDEDSCDEEDHLMAEKKDEECGRAFEIADITNIMYGGLSSRFWMLRKHINLMTKQELQNLPFHSWNCLTICFKRRDLDLVISNEADMQLFIKFLIYRLKTVDGIRGSSAELLNKMNQKEIRAYQKENEESKLTSKKLKEINLKNEHHICQKVMMRYKIMKLRAKISFAALMKEMTIHELLVSQIHKSFTEIIDQSAHGKEKTTNEEQEECVLQAILDGEEGILAKLIEMKHFKKLATEVITKGLAHEEKVVHVKVWKNGREIESTLDLGKNIKTMRAVQKLFRKGQASDLFRDVVIDKKASLQSEMRYQEYIKMKWSLMKMKIMMQKLNLIQNFKIVSGTVYIRCILKKIQLAREATILRVQQGHEVLIPYALSQDHLPHSFRYYDSILRVIQSGISQRKSDFYLVRKQLAYGHHEESEINQLKKCIGLRERPDRNYVKSAKPKEIPTHADINHSESIHVRELQRSKYIKIDDDICEEKCQPSKQIVEASKVERPTVTGYKVDMGGFSNQKPGIKYVERSTVINNQKKSLMFKQKFLNQISHLKNLNQRNNLERRIDNWVTENIEKLNPRIKRSRSCNSKDAVVDEKDKQKSIAIFVAEAEKIIRSKSLRARKKQIQISNEMQAGDYEARLKYLEESIERTMRFIGGADLEDNKIEQLRRDVREVDKHSQHMRKRQAQQNLASTMQNSQAQNSQRSSQKAKLLHSQKIKMKLQNEIIAKMAK